HDCVNSILNCIESIGISLLFSVNVFFGYSKLINNTVTALCSLCQGLYLFINFPHAATGINGFKSSDPNFGIFFNESVFTFLISLLFISMTNTHELGNGVALT